MKVPLNSWFLSMTLLISLLFVTLVSANAGPRKSKSRSSSRASMTASTATEPCICLLFPVYNLGGGYHLYFADQHEQCGSEELCSNPLDVFHAYAQGNSPQDCVDGDPMPCLNTKRSQSDLTREIEVRLEKPMPNDLDESNPLLNPNKDVASINLVRRDVTFRTPRGTTIHARVFLRTLSYPKYPTIPAREVGFGCEIVDDEGAEGVNWGEIPYYRADGVTYEYLFQTRRGSVIYTIVTHN